MRKLMLATSIIALFVFALTACGVEPSSTVATTLEAGSPPGQAEGLATAVPIHDESTAASTGSFTLSSPDVVEGGALPIEYTCDGDSATLPLTWSGAPANSQSFAIVMHHIPGPDDSHWYWVLYDIPANVTGLAKNSAGVGTLGSNSVNGEAAYAPPCSKGPGEKMYTYTVYALSAQPQFSVPASGVSRSVLLDAIQDITLASAELNVTYARSGSEENQPTPEQGSAPETESQPAEAAETTSSDSTATTFKLEAWADNWFAAYLGENLIVEDSVSITTERSFNAETVTFDASYPLMLNFILKDFKENDTGLEYIGTPQQQMGDGGFIMQLTDLSTGTAVAVSNADWACTVIHEAPLDKSCADQANPVAGTAPCTFTDSGEPTGWKSPDFDDSAWTATTVYSASDVRPKDGYDQIRWDASAQFIWGPDLQTNNTVLCRIIVSAPASQN
ncbi:MAG: YbhB/YbcL family Raf kinase inhibitor-like protein [Chloroflexota bacterium]